MGAGVVIVPCVAEVSGFLCVCYCSVGFLALSYMICMKHVICSKQWNKITFDLMTAMFLSNDIIKYGST